METQFWAKFVKSSKFSWMCQMARNLCISMYKHNRYHISNVSSTLDIDLSHMLSLTMSKKARPIEKLNDLLFFRVSAIFSDIDWIVHLFTLESSLNCPHSLLIFLCTKVCFRFYFCTVWFWETYSSFARQ